MKTEINLQRYALETLIESYDNLLKHLESPDTRAYYIGKRSAYEDLLILFHDNMDLQDLHSEALTPSDERMEETNHDKQGNETGR